jgi:ABC-type glycerol-3-phosphate transport system permease component
MSAEALPEELKTKFQKEQVYFFSSLLSFIVIIISFWEFETRIWNRVQYNFGATRWNSGFPYYSVFRIPNDEYFAILLNLVLLMTMFTAIYTLSGILFLLEIRKKKKYRVYSIYLIISFLTYLSAWWNSKTIVLSPNGWFESTISQVSEDIWLFLGLSLGSADTIYSTFQTLLLFCRIASLTVFIFNLILIIEYKVSNIVSGKANKLEDIKTHGIKAILDKNITYSKFSKGFMFYTIMILFSTYTVMPILYTLLLSFSNYNQDFGSDRFFPQQPMDNFIINYSSVIFHLSDTRPTFSRSFMISVFLGAGAAIGGLAIALPAAYAISRFRFVGRGTAQWLVLATQMFPGIILLLPQFLLWIRLGLITNQTQGTFFFGILERFWIVVFGVLLAYFVGAIAYNVWMMRGYFDTLPTDLEEAALIDGSSNFGAFIRIALPLAVPGMVAVGIFTFFGAWNEFALAQLFIGEGKLFAPLPLMFFQYQNTGAPDVPVFFELLSAFSILAALPMIILFMSLNKFLSGGLTQGGIK